MIDYSEIEKTLLESEANYDTSFAALTKIAPLYCAMLYKMFSSKTAVSQPEPLDVSGDSDFLSKVNYLHVDHLCKLDFTSHALANLGCDDYGITHR